MVFAVEFADQQKLVICIRIYSISDYAALLYLLSVHCTSGT